MSTPCHTFSASIVALYMLDVTPSNTPLLLLAMFSATLPDMDHIYLVYKNRKRFKESENPFELLDEARSIFHELPGYLIISIIMLLISLFNYEIAFLVGVPFIIHLIQDMLIGTSFPLEPVSSLRIRLFSQRPVTRIGQEAITYISSFALWYHFLVS